VFNFLKPIIYKPVSSVRDLHRYGDVCSRFDILTQIRCIRRSLPRSSLTTLITAFILFKVDYCNVALSACQACRIVTLRLERVQSVITAAARLTTGARKYDHVTPLLKDLHWLRVPERIS